MSIIILSLLMIKHFYVDFVHQTSEHVKFKGVYGHFKGIEHSFLHGLFTAAIFWIWFDPVWASIIGLIDFVLHYHIDYVKMKYGEKDPNQKAYWVHFGLDQLAHNLTYIFIIFIAIG